MSAGRAVKVAAVGGSVTAGGGAGGSEYSYTGRIHSWLSSLGSEEQPVNVTVSPASLPCSYSS